MRDPWVILGLPRAAGDDEIRSRYRELARALHPDRNQGNPEAAVRFQEVAVAFDSIRTEERREAWLASNESALHFRPPDEARDIEISFLDAFRGVQKAVEVVSDEVCRTCGGSGAAPGSSPRRCGTCQGSGEVSLGELSSSCGECGGHGYLLPMPCGECHRGRVREEREMLLRIPPGTPPGQTLLLQDGPQAFAFRILIADSPVFERIPGRVADLLLRVPITFSEAILGADVRIPTPDRVVELHIPPGTPPGKRFRISGSGMPGYEGASDGDLYVEVAVDIPPDPSSKTRELAKELSREENPDELRLRLFRS